MPSSNEVSHEDLFFRANNNYYGAFNTIVTTVVLCTKFNNLVQKTFI